MTLSRILRSSLLALMLGGAASSALAAAAVAMGNGNFTYAITDAFSLETAKADALKACSKQAGSCSLLVWSTSAGAIALAKGEGGVSGVIDDDPAQARATALRMCSKQYRNCKHAAMYWEPGGAWAAWAFAKDDAGSVTGHFFVYDVKSRDEARKMAIDACLKQQQGYKAYDCKVETVYGDAGYAQVDSASYGSLQVREKLAEAIAAAMADCKAKSKPDETCKLTDKAVNTGRRPAPASFSKIVSLSDTGRGEARRDAPPVATRALRHTSCTNRCVNGSCVRTFADGRTEAWQAPRIFDPLANDWKWDTSSCGS